MSNKRKLNESPVEELVIGSKKLKFFKTVTESELNGFSSNFNQVFETAVEGIYDVYYFSEEGQNSESDQDMDEDSNAEDNWRNDYPEEYDFELDESSSNDRSDY